ncbi:MAG: UV DNA damage repair endonuclease UvsE [Anaerolineae bacterium]
MRIGFPGRIFGRPRLKTHDGRRPPQYPHLSVSLLYLRDILEYLHQQDIRLYRMSPYLLPADAASEEQIAECHEMLAFVGELAGRYGIRLTMHALAYTTLSTPDDQLAEHSRRELARWSRLADAMRLPAESVIVLHVGGIYGDGEASKERFLRRLDTLPDNTRSRLALENDDASYSLADVHQLAQRAGLPIVLDYLHFLNHNPEGLPLSQAVRMAQESWPAGVRPKIHFSSPRTELKGATVSGLKGAWPPQWTEHADFVNPFEFIRFLQEIPDAGNMDVMLEARARDLAVLRLTADLHRFAPALARLHESSPGEHPWGM